MFLVQLKEINRLGKETVSGKLPPENSHPANSPWKIPTWKIPTQKIPTWNIPTHVFKHSHPSF